MPHNQAINVLKDQLYSLLSKKASVDLGSLLILERCFLSLLISKRYSLNSSQAWEDFITPLAAIALADCLSESVVHLKYSSGPCRLSGTRLDEVICRMDDILIYRRNQMEHDGRVRAVLFRLQEAGLTLTIDKCELSQGRIKFQGHIVDTDGVHANPEKARAIAQFPVPSNITE